jgi:hypothetical protein
MKNWDEVKVQCPKSKLQSWGDRLGAGLLRGFRGFALIMKVEQDEGGAGEGVFAKRSHLWNRIMTCGNVIYVENESEIVRKTKPIKWGIRSAECGISQESRGEGGGLNKVMNQRISESTSERIVGYPGVGARVAAKGHEGAIIGTLHNHRLASARQGKVCLPRRKGIMVGKRKLGCQRRAKTVPHAGSAFARKNFFWRERAASQASPMSNSPKSKVQSYGDPGTTWNHVLRGKRRPALRSTRVNPDKPG